MREQAELSTADVAAVRFLVAGGFAALGEGTAYVHALLSRLASGD